MGSSRKIKNALISVFYKEGIDQIAKELDRLGVNIYSTGGTQSFIEDLGVKVNAVENLTSYPSILGGRVKTLHPKVFGGILARRALADDQKQLAEFDIPEFDLVIVDLYPFEETVANGGSEDEIIEKIDIGGISLIRAAAKNFKDVLTVSSLEQYGEVIELLQTKNGETELKDRKRFARQAFDISSNYDSAIYNYFMSDSEETPSLKVSERRSNPLRYGENPHQSAHWYSHPRQGWGGAIQLQGKELSTNNLLDLEAALATVREFGYGESGVTPSRQPAAVVVKHTNPCGVAVGSVVSAALSRALDADRISAFGGIVAINGVVDASAARELTSLFLECVVAPGFTPDAREILAGKANLRLLELAPEAIDAAGPDHVRSILGGLLVQDLDDQLITPDEWTVATQRPPSLQERQDLEFAWRLVRHVRSNAIVVAKSGQSLGVGAGQMNRVGSARIALDAAGEQVNGAVLASDGFFPFDDTVRLAASRGITAVIHPGGSKRDADSIKACDELGLSMLLTGRRHFLH